MACLGDRYRLVERVGYGGMSVVWRARDEVLSRDVAVKLLNPRLSDDDGSRTRIRLEALAAARLSHPNITAVYDYGQATDERGRTVPYVVMEFIHGRSLAARLTDGPLPWRTAVRVVAEVAAALAAAHARGVVHRDVKPANVMLTGCGAKVLDFGIAASIGQREDGSTVLGTPAYLAPERIAGRPAEPATDVYAVGLLLYKALTGRLPWEVGSTPDMLTAHRYRDPDPLPRIAGMPRWVGDLCLRCLAKRPEDRPSAEQVATRLAQAVGVQVPLPGDETLTDALPVDPATRAARRGRALPAGLAVWYDRHRVLARTAAAGTALGVTGALVAVSAIGAKSDLAHGGGAVQAAFGAQPVGCQVRYETRRDWGTGFAVDLTITNTGASPVKDWTLTFDFPGGQRVVNGSDARWEQSANHVTVRDSGSDATIAPGSSTTVAFTGSADGANPMPTTFKLNGSSCERILVGASAAPSPAAPATKAGTHGGAKPAPPPHEKGKGKGGKHDK
ncbi:MAG TPA: protein kinase [Micromonosporaceae bacterium]